MLLIIGSLALWRSNHGARIGGSVPANVPTGGRLPDGRGDGCAVHLSARLLRAFASGCER